MGNGTSATGRQSLGAPEQCEESRASYASRWKVRLVNAGGIQTVTTRFAVTAASRNPWVDQVVTGAVVATGPHGDVQPAPSGANSVSDRSTVPPLPVWVVPAPIRSESAISAGPGAVSNRSGVHTTG